MPRSDTEFMQQALEMAETARASGEVPVGAVLVKNDEVIARGYNRPSRHMIRARTPRSKRCALAARRSAAIASPIRFST
jgi:tRNA(adenine34) deaminase